jgi:hypothetical protein
VWIDVTTRVDQLARSVCGSVNSLGSFTIAQSNNFVTFNFTGGQQTWLVPAGVTTVDIDARGAAGASTTQSSPGGKGGRVQTTVAVTPGETLFIYVGGAGAGSVGGFNGGGQGGAGGPGAGGGGASDIRRNAALITDRIAVAGGGGGAGADAGCAPATGGGGGGVTGGISSKCFFKSGAAAVGGNQVAGGAGGSSSLGNSGNAGALGVGGNGGAGSAGGGGGGGGYFGGGGGGANINNGGGGGSSFSSGTNTGHTQGFSVGNGQVVITPRP